MYKYASSVNVSTVHYEVMTSEHYRHVYNKAYACYMGWPDRSLRLYKGAQNWYIQIGDILIDLIHFIIIIYHSVIETDKLLANIHKKIRIQAGSQKCF